MIDDILNMPACPHQVYDSFWSKVREAVGCPNRRHDVTWMTEEEAIAVCVKEGITSSSQLKQAMGMKP